MKIGQTVTFKFYVKYLTAFTSRTFQPEQVVKRKNTTKNRSEKNDVEKDVTHRTKSGSQGGHAGVWSD